MSTPLVMERSRVQSSLAAPATSLNIKDLAGVGGNASRQILANVRGTRQALSWKTRGLCSALVLGALALAGCSDADVASSNLSKAADNFEINRRVVFYNGITGDYILSVEGLCSLGNSDSVKKLTVTCKTGPNAYKKHFLGLSDNVTFFAEQIEPAPANVYHYRVIFKPSVIVPAVEVK